MYQELNTHILFINYITTNVLIWSHHIFIVIHTYIYLYKSFIFFVKDKDVELRQPSSVPDWYLSLNLGWEFLKEKKKVRKHPLIQEIKNLSKKKRTRLRKQSLDQESDQ